MTDDALEEGGSAPPSKARGFSFLPLSFFFFFLVLFSSGPSLGLASSSIMSSYAALSARSLALRSSVATATRRFSSSSLCTLVAPWWYAGIGREFAAAGFPLRLVAAAVAGEGLAEQPAASSVAGRGMCGLQRAPSRPRFCIASASEDPAPGPEFGPRKKAAGRARPSASLKSPTPLTGLELSPLVRPVFSPCSIALTRCAATQHRRNCC